MPGIFARAGNNHMVFRKQCFFRFGKMAYRLSNRFSARCWHWPRPLGLDVTSQPNNEHSFTILRNSIVDCIHHLVLNIIL